MVERQRPSPLHTRVCVILVPDQSFYSRLHVTKHKVHRKLGENLITLEQRQRTETQCLALTHPP